MLLDFPFVIPVAGQTVNENKLAIGPCTFWKIVSAPVAADNTPANVTITIPGQSPVTRTAGTWRRLPLVDAFDQIKVSCDVAGTVIICLGQGEENGEPIETPPVLQRVVEPFGNQVSEGFNTVNAGAQAALFTLTRANLKRVWLSIPATEPGPVRIQTHSGTVMDLGGLWLSPGGEPVAIQGADANTPTTVAVRGFNPGAEAVRVYYRAEYQSIVP
jgi:hypothetical protein